MVNMLAFDLLTPREIQVLIAKKVKEKRLYQDMSQVELSKRSGVSLGSLKRFESSGEISFKSLLCIAFTLGELTPFNELFPSPPPTSLFAKKTRKRQRSSARK